MEFHVIVLYLCMVCTVSSTGHSVFLSNDVQGPIDVKRVHEGEHVVLDCEVGGSPSPTVHWLMNGHRLSLGSANSVFDDEAFYEHTAHNELLPQLGIGSTKSKLFIDCVTKDHEGVYTCVGDTEAKRVTRKTKLIVVPTNQVSSPCETLLHQEGSKPRVYMWTAQRLELEDADVQLYCRATGTPAPHVTWLDINGERIESGATGQYEVLNNGDLLIKHISFEYNMGVYTCVAENDHGRDKIGAFLYPTTLE